MAKRKQPFTYHVPPGQNWAELPSRRLERRSSTPWLYEDPEPDDDVAPAWLQQLQPSHPEPPAPEPAPPPPPWLQSTPATPPHLDGPADAPPEPAWLYHGQPTPPPPAAPTTPPSWGAYSRGPAAPAYGGPPGGYAGGPAGVAPGYPPPPYAPGPPPAPAGRPTGAGGGSNGALAAVLAVILVVAVVVGYLALHRSTPKAAAHLGAPDLKSELLGVNDLPAGWTVDHSSDNGGSGDSPACFEKADQAMNTLTQAGADFANDPSTLSENLAWFPGTGSTLAFNSLSSALSGCGRVTITDTDFSATGQLSQMSIPPLGDQTAAWQLPLTTAVDGQTVQFAMDVVVVRQQQTIITLFAFAPGAPDPSTLQSVTQRAVNKVP